MNLHEIKFNFRFGDREEAKLFLKQCDKFNLSKDLLGKSFTFNNKNYYFIGFSYSKFNSINILNKLTNTKYNQISDISKYQAVFLCSEIPSTKILNRYSVLNKYSIKSGNTIYKISLQNCISILLQN